MNGKPGRTTYTQWLNPACTLEAELTVTKLAEDRFWAVAPTPRTGMRKPGCAGTSATPTRS